MKEKKPPLSVLEQIRELAEGIESAAIKLVDDQDTRGPTHSLVKIESDAVAIRRLTLPTPAPVRPPGKIVFAVGDRVRLKTPCRDGGPPVGELGTVREVTHREWVGVFWDTWRAGHDLNGNLRAHEPQNGGWHTSPDNLELLPLWSTRPTLPPAPFREGDRVVYVNRVNGPSEGTHGTVRSFSIDPERIGVEWDGWERGHSLDGRLVVSPTGFGTGWYVPASSLRREDAVARAYDPTTTDELLDDGDPFADDYTVEEEH